MIIELIKIFYREDLNEKLLKEIAELRQTQKQILIELEQLHDLKEAEVNKTYYRYIVGAVVVIVVVGVVCYCFNDSTSTTHDFINSLSTHCTNMNKINIDRLGLFERNLSVETKERQELLIKLLKGLEDRLAHLLNKVSTQIARSSDNNFNSNSFFERGSGRRLGKS